MQCSPLKVLDVNPSDALSVEEGSRIVGSFATYSCAKGYKLVGEAKRACLQHGVWGGAMPDCERK